MKLDKKGDVGLVEDTIFTLKNLLATEDHSALSYGMSKDDKWIEILEIIRRIRTKWLAIITKKEKSQLYCFSKHILAASEGLIEISNRFIQTKQFNEGREALNDATELISLFLILNGHEKQDPKKITSA